MHISAPPGFRIRTIKNEIDEKRTWNVDLMVITVGKDLEVADAKK